ncbi:MAG: fatty acid desaturase [Saprospiraceae bacterium]|jgi:stearoyl-CoA desaturase (delta-9 desaturase)|nr:fatty acid desaturase [Saprospiraceae bacterium]
MTLIDRMLDPPYGWMDKKGELIKPTPKQLFSEFFQRLNIFKTKKNWLGFLSWFWLLAISPFFILFFVKYFSWKLALVGFLYSMVLMGSHATIWYHRYSTHRAFRFKNVFWRFLTRNLVIKVIFEEAYVISHHVHHTKSERPGDPYNALAGGLYCFLADVNHQKIAQDLSEDDYHKVKGFLTHTGMYINTYEEYQKWGSFANPTRSVIYWILNWSFWYLVFFLIGGHALAFTLFASAGVWAVGVRTFNFEGHGKGKDKRQEGIDFHWEDLSVNQIWPGYVAGEWHNNHHLFPRSARNGFLPYQLDLPWCYIYLLHKIGGISEFRNDHHLFLEKYYQPYKDGTIVKKVKSSGNIKH